MVFRPGVSPTPAEISTRLWTRFCYDLPVNLPLEARVRSQFAR